MSGRRVHQGYASGRVNGRPPAVVESRQGIPRNTPMTWGRGTDVGVVTRTATDGRDMLVNSPDGWEVDAPWLWWNGPAGGDGTGGPLGNPPPGAGPGWRRVPAAVTRCTSLICDTLAGMPWQVRRGRELLDTPAWIGDPQQLRRDARVYGGVVPQWRRSAVEFRSSVIKSCLWKGEGIVYVPVRNDDGSPAPPVWQLNPDEISEEGGVYYVPGGRVSPVTGEQSEEYEFGDGELIITRAILTDDVRGMGVLRAHFWDLALAGQVSGYALNLLQSGIPAGYLKVNAPQLTQDKARGLSKDWMAAHGGIMRKIAVLNSTVDFVKLGLDPVAMELAKIRDYSTLDIALIFGVPPYMLGLTQASDTYANVESRMIELGQFTLLPWARRFESTWDAELPRGTDMKINMDGLRRADTLTRYRAHQIALGGGNTEPFLTVDEVRDMEDRPPMEAEQAIEQIAAQQGLRVVEATNGGPQ